MAEEAIGDYDNALKAYNAAAETHSSEPVVLALDRSWRGRPVSTMAAASARRLAEWMKKDYKLNDSEIALLFGDVLKYDITELVDPHFNVAAKVPKSVLATLNK